MTFIDITCMSDRSEEVIIETFPRRNDTPFFMTRSCRLLLAFADDSSTRQTIFARSDELMIGKVANVAE